MKILMMTNTYSPHVGGVARSIRSFTEEFRRRGHRVVVVAPFFDGTPGEELDVVRVPAWRHLGGSDFSVPLPAPGLLTAALGDFRPDVVHSHHPFLLGGTALAVARVHGAPLVFTHHTLYEQYTHYGPMDSPAAKRFIIRFATGYANLVDRVFAPSQTLAEDLRRRGVKTPVTVVPTGVDLSLWRGGDGGRYRRAKGIPAEAFLVGHFGRLAQEKNLRFLGKAVVRFMKKRPNSCFLLAGIGPMGAPLERLFEREGLIRRFYREERQDPAVVCDSLHALDAFAFSSQSETQGMVLTEAMACGVPVVALDGPGVRDVLEDGGNGRSLTSGNEGDFAAALDWVARSDVEVKTSLRQGALRTAAFFSLKACADTALAAYRTLVSHRAPEPMPWEAALRWVSSKWDLLSNATQSAREAFHDRAR
jgi:1,2-diacylglycerol 3-alpha-glucosyltransferase